MGQRGARGSAPAVIAPPSGAAAIDDRVFLGAILAAGAALRAWLPFRHVFTGAFVNVQTNDAWYHLRLIDVLARQFPHPLHVDAYAAAGGLAVPVGPLFDFLIVAAARAIGLGRPSLATLETVAAWAPVVFALVTIAVTYAIGRRMFDSLTGLLAAALLATMPGPFLDRTVLGYVDHHAAEACFSALTLLGVTWSLQRARAGDPRAPREAVAASLVTGIALGAYLITWTSGVFLIFILASWAVLQYVCDRLWSAGSDRVVRAVVPAAMVAAAIVALCEDSRVPQHDVRLLGLGTTVGTVIVLEILRRATARVRMPPAVFAAALAGVFVAIAAGAALWAPGTVAAALNNVRRLVPDASAQTVGEARSLVSVNTAASAVAAWVQFRTTFFLAIPGLVLLAVDVWRRRIEERALLLVWTVVAMLATLAQNRFGYYLAIELALIAAWLSARVLRWAGATSVAPRARLLADAVVVVVAAVVFYPSVPPALQTARYDFGMPVAWQHALTWMRTSTPEPFGDPDRYFAREDAGGGAGDGIAAPPPAYTVMNWWDYGYWLMRTAHRVPVSNPTQYGAGDAARFYTETDPDEAYRVLERTRARYIVTGQELPATTAPATSPWRRWFEAMPVWAHRSSAIYYDWAFERAASGELTTVRLYYPDYYRTMTSRLYLFGGRAVTPRNSTWVVTLASRRDADGLDYHEVTSSRLFASYDEAAAQLARMGPGDHRIVGRDPAQSCVPLPALARVRVAYESPERASAFPGVPAVTIFEFRRNQTPAN